MPVLRKLGVVGFRTPGGESMRKINDRFLLGLIGRLGGNVAKIAVERIAVKTLGFNDTGAKKAAGIFIRGNQAESPLGRILGNIADNMIASGLGVTCAYWLTLMGKDYYLLKGAALGAAEWTALYGLLSRMGATAVYPSTALNGLVTLVSHLVFGMTKIQIVYSLGDQRLFTPSSSARQTLQSGQISQISADGQSSQAPTASRSSQTQTADRGSRSQTSDQSSLTPTADSSAGSRQSSQRDPAWTP